ncbi:hypothetical protein L596_001458 [Steinernema carpocapsae]|uniref:CCR4-NOT transcription complex subunit 1 CAF1-binding domain-containing protein n=1 Tax=Steinernema carpocapsae TaxID=34508 RepID=A0A4U8UL51_STECR|nr:hypothetical protein L596_001458 [Steinernema carpocapsae]
MRVVANVNDNLLIGVSWILGDKLDQKVLQEAIRFGLEPENSRSRIEAPPERPMYSLGSIMMRPRSPFCDWEPDTSIVTYLHSTLSKMSGTVNSSSYASNSYVNSSVTTLMQYQCAYSTEFVPWFSRYLLNHCMKSPNAMLTACYQFFSFLCFRKPCLRPFMRKECIVYIKRILEKPCELSTIAQDGAHLKNLGSWLGFMTIGSNRPLLREELDINEVLRKASYVRGTTELLMVVPFVARILRASRMSILFSPDSAWITSILKTLAAIYDNERDLTRLSVRFEIETLMMHLGFKINELIVERRNEDTTVDIASRLEYSSFAIKHEGDAMTSPLLLSRDLGITLAAAELYLHCCYPNDVIYANLEGINEEVIIESNGFIMNMPDVENVRELVGERRMFDVHNEARNVPSQTPFYQYVDPMHDPHVQDAAPSSMFSVDSDDEPLPVDFNHCAETLFYDLFKKYNSGVRIDAFDSLYCMLMAYCEQGLLSEQCAEPFLEACMYAYVKKGYDMCGDGDEMTHRHQCHFLGDALGSLIVVTVEEYEQRDGTSAEFVGKVFHMLFDVLSEDLAQKTYRKFLPFMYARLILSVIWGLNNVCLRLRSEPLLLEYQKKFAELMHMLRPEIMPAFAFYWLEMVGNHKVISCFNTNKTQGYASRAIYAKMMATLNQFITDFIDHHGAFVASIETLLEGFQDAA